MDTGKVIERAEKDMQTRLKYLFPYETIVGSDPEEEKEITVANERKFFSIINHNTTDLALFNKEFTGYMGTWLDNLDGRSFVKLTTDQIHANMIDYETKLEIIRKEIVKERGFNSSKGIRGKERKINNKRTRRNQYTM